MLKAVVLDNQATSRNLLSSLLSNGGHEVVDTGNLSQAVLARIVKLKPQVVCIDIGEANQPGWAILDNAREQLPKAMFFLVSAKLDAPTIAAAQQRGVHGFIVKPFNPALVLAAIRKAVLRLISKQTAQKNEQKNEQQAAKTETQIQTEPEADSDMESPT
jgi:two-component system chemotaxis response regulator CheY